MGKQRQTTGGPSTISSAAMAFTHPPADEPSSMRWVAIAAAAMVTSTGVGYGYLTMQSDVLTPRPASALTEQVPAQASEPEPAAAPDPISITIRSKPEGAEVFRASDGLRVGMTPYKYTLDPVDGELIYTLKLDDYQPETVTFSARDGGVRLLTLRPVIAVPAAPPVDANEPKESEQRAPMKTKAARRTRTPKNPIEKPTSREQSRIADDAVFNPFE